MFNSLQKRVHTRIVKYTFNLPKAQFWVISKSYRFKKSFSHYVFQIGIILKITNKPTCYKNPMSTSCIDLSLRKSSKYFPISNVFQTGLSGFHNSLKMVITSYYNYHKTSHHKFKLK